MFHFVVGTLRCVLRLKMDQRDFFKDLFPNHDDNRYLLNMKEEVNNNQDDDLVNIGEEVELMSW